MKKYSISLKVELEIEGRESLLQIERKVKAKLEEAGPILLDKIFRRQEEIAVSEEWECSVCHQKGLWKNCGRVQRKIVTLVGAVCIKRLQWRCQRCGRYCYPLDERIGLEARENVSLGVVEQSLFLAVEMPYDRAAKCQEKLCGISVSGRQIQNWAKAEGQQMLAVQKQERKALFEGGVLPEKEKSNEELGRVFVQVDGTFVNERSRPGEVEAKVGVIYSEKEKVAAHRWEILDKRTFASVDRLEEFREQLILECHRWGVWEAKEIIFAGDGATWIKRLCKQDFPNAIYLLDFWHLMENTYRTFGEERKMTADSLLSVAKQGRSQEFYEGLDRSFRRSRDPDFRSKMEDLLVYVRNNLEGIENYRKLGMVGSSGAIEKAVDVTICRRFKKRGMSWFRPGLSSLLALKLLKLNREWDAYWKTRGLPLN